MRTDITGIQKQKGKVAILTFRQDKTDFKKKASSGKRKQIKID